jgi:hypothetical protein
MIILSILLTVHPICFDLNGSIEEIIRNKPIATAEILQSENLVIKEILNYTLNNNNKQAKREMTTNSK